MLVFQGQNFYCANFIEMHASKKLKLFCVTDCRKYQSSLLRGIKKQVILEFWVKFFHYRLGLAINTPDLDFFFKIFFNQRVSNPHISKIFHTVRNLHLCVQFTLAHLRPCICIFKCSSYIYYIYIYIISLSALGLFPPLSGAKLRAAEHNSPFVVGWMLS